MQAHPPPTFQGENAAWKSRGNLDLPPPLPRVQLLWTWEPAQVWLWGWVPRAVSQLGGSKEQVRAKGRDGGRR